MRTSSLLRRGASPRLVPLVAAAVLAGCTTSPEESPSARRNATSASPRPGEDAAGRSVTTVASGLESPWSIAFHDETAPAQREGLRSDRRAQRRRRVARG